MRDIILCLDSGTTTVKAAAFDRHGRLLAVAEAANTALRRDGIRVEQDMIVTRNGSMSVLRECVGKISGDVAGLIVTGQGDGLWPLDKTGQPVGHALTWLDGRARALVGEHGHSGDLDRVEAITSARPTAATQSLQLAWLQQHEPERLTRIAHALRLKEWLFFSLTGELKAEPTAVLPSWGDWRNGGLSHAVEEILGLKTGIALLPQLEKIGDCRSSLSKSAAEQLGLPPGIPVLLGPGDVQSTIIGMGVGLKPELSRCSIFGTSAIHASHVLDPLKMQTKPAGAMIQQFALGEGYICSHPSFNGTTAFQHIARLTGEPTGLRTISPHYSGVLIHPFFEPGGERAPYTTPHAKGALIGVTSATTSQQIQWATREALVFVSRKSHEMMNSTGSDMALGGGLAADDAFASFFATTLGRNIHRSTSGHASLRGVGMIAAFHLLGEPLKSLPDRWIVEADSIAQPEKGSVAHYAERKYALFSTLVDVVSPCWDDMSALASLAAEDMTIPAGKENLQ
ncbi:MAG: FGGY family carbohydrate kinase [Phyllobacterium sp.]